MCLMNWDAMFERVEARESHLRAEALVRKQALDATFLAGAKILREIVAPPLEDAARQLGGRGYKTHLLYFCNIEGTTLECESAEHARVSRIDFYARDDFSASQLGFTIANLFSVKVSPEKNSILIEDCSQEFAGEGVHIPIRRFEPETFEKLLRTYVLRTVGLPV